MVPESPSTGGHGIAFVISPTTDFTHAVASQHLGLFNSTNMGSESSHVVVVELDTMRSPELQDIDDNHVELDLNTLISTPSDLSTYLNESMYVGFSSSTSTVTSARYILGWSFAKVEEEPPPLDLRLLPVSPRPSKPVKKLGTAPKVFLVSLSISLVAIAVVILSISLVAIVDEHHIGFARQPVKVGVGFVGDEAPGKLSVANLDPAAGAAAGRSRRNPLGDGGSRV
ncbi:unnamed protein product [Linum trigynum]|uniref:Legume lectin domain-containing protein n=1 Tax=Linum trigynum TaxID=586398 RepID=A0AAV2G109_9ROSI